jgi:multimeric flavodoxin WrbA
MDKGNTALILIPFLDGMEEAGAKVERLCTKKLKINPCQGEISCWLKTPGECFQKDDMQMVLSKLRLADIWVFATPVYLDGVTGPMIVDVKALRALVTLDGVPDVHLLAN